MNNVSVTRPYTKRRQYTPEFKAQLVAECQRLGTSVSRVALDNDLNANWTTKLAEWGVSESKQADKILSPAFVPINLPSAPAVV